MRVVTGLARRGDVHEDLGVSAAHRAGAPRSA